MWRGCSVSTLCWLLMFARCSLAVRLEGAVHVGLLRERMGEHHKLPNGGLLRLRGGGADGAASSAAIPSEWVIRSALTGAGTVAKSIPPALLRAVRDGRVGLEVIDRFVTWHQQLPRCLRWVLQIEIVRQRILADDTFLFKVVIEATLACAVQAVAEAQHRGEDFGQELDFALGGIVAVLYSSAVSTLLAAPVAVPRKAQKRESRWDAFLRTCPSSVFQEGPPPYSTLQRVATLLYHMPRLFVTGFSASFVAYVYITVVLLVRHAISKVFVGGKWRRKPKTLKELKETLAASAASAEGAGAQGGHAGDAQRMRVLIMRLSCVPSYLVTAAWAPLQAICSGDRQDLLEEVGLGALSDVGLAAIGIDPSSLPPSSEATSWLNEAPAPAWEAGGRGTGAMSAEKTATSSPAYTPSPYHKAPPAAAALANRHGSPGGEPSISATIGAQIQTGNTTLDTHRQEGRGGLAVDKAWETNKLQAMGARPMRVRSRSFNDISHLLQVDGAESPEPCDDKGPGEVLRHADTCPALLPDGEGCSADKNSAGEVCAERQSKRERAHATPAGLAPSLDPTAQAPGHHANRTLPESLRDAAASAKAAAGGGEGKRRLSSPPIASPVQSLTRSSTMLADAISVGRQPILRRLPGAPKVLFRGGKYGLALSLMIEGPSLMRPSPSLVFLPPQAGKGEGIGLIPWAEVINVSLMCGLYVAVFSNIRGHIVAGIEMRILDKVLSGKRQPWRPLGSVLLRTLNLYIGSITLLMGLELFSPAQDAEPDALEGIGQDGYGARSMQRSGMSHVAAVGSRDGVNSETIAGLRSGAMFWEGAQPKAAATSGMHANTQSGSYTWCVREERGAAVGQERDARSSSLPVPMTQQYGGGS